MLDEALDSISFNAELLTRSSTQTQEFFSGGKGGGRGGGGGYSISPRSPKQGSGKHEEGVEEEKSP